MDADRSMVFLITRSIPSPKIAATATGFPWSRPANRTGFTSLHRVHGDDHGFSRLHPFAFILQDTFTVFQYPITSNEHEHDPSVPVHEPRSRTRSRFFCIPITSTAFVRPRTRQFSLPRSRLFSHHEHDLERSTITTTIFSRPSLGRNQ
jgi:hypothetical protein